VCGPSDSFIGVGIVSCRALSQDADRKLAIEPLGDQTMDQHTVAQCRVGVIRKVIGSAEDRQCAVAVELVDMPTGVDHCSTTIAQGHAAA